MAENMYRKKALEKLSEAEQLDRAINIIKPRYWIALLAIVIITLGVILWACNYTMEIKTQFKGMYVVNGDANSYGCNEPGIVKEVKVKDDDIVKKGQVIFEYAETGKQAFVSPVTGIVTNIKVTSGTQVEVGQKIITIRGFNGQASNSNVKLDTQNDEDLFVAKKDKKVIAFTSAKNYQQLEVGMKVQVYPDYYNSQEGVANPGYMFGHISKINSEVLEENDIENLLGSKEYIKLLDEDLMTFMFEIELEKDSQSNSGYKWSEEDGKKLDLQEGTFVKVYVTTLNMKPIDAVFPSK